MPSREAEEIEEVLRKESGFDWNFFPDFNLYEDSPGGTVGQVRRTLNVLRNVGLRPTPAIVYSTLELQRELLKESGLRIRALESRAVREEGLIGALPLDLQYVEWLAEILLDLAKTYLPLAGAGVVAAFSAAAGKKIFDKIMNRWSSRRRTSPLSEETRELFWEHTVDVFTTEGYTQVRSKLESLVPKKPEEETAA